MSPFKRIANELESLGWTREQGKGDHVIYNKEGYRQIVIYVGLEEKSRSYQNQLAEIRRIEPEFKLGKSVTPKKNQEPEQIVSVEEPNCPIWLMPGSYVRYTGPEKRDWSKLQDPNSLMNQKYIIVDKDGDTASIKKEDDGSIIIVPVKDLDAYQLNTCSDCGGKYPSNYFLDINDNPYNLGAPVCRTCAMMSDKFKAKAKKNPTIDLSLDQNGHISKEKRDILSQKLKESPHIMPSASQITEMEKLVTAVSEQVTPSLYKCWQTFIILLTASLARERRYKVNSKEYQRLQRQLMDIDRKLLKTKDMNILQVMTNMKDTTTNVWRFILLLESSFEPMFPDHKFIVQLVNKKEKINQFISTYYCDRENIDKMVKYLDEDENKFIRIRKDTEVTNGGQVMYECIDFLKSSIGENWNKYIGLNCCNVVDDGYSDNRFETAPSHCHVEIIVNTSQREGKTWYDALIKAKDAICEGTPKSVMILTDSDDSDEARKKGFSTSIAPDPELKLNLEAETETESENGEEQHSVKYGYRKGEIMLLIKKETDTHCRTYYGEPDNEEEEKEYLRQLGNIFEQYLYDKDNVIGKALNATFDKYNNNKHNEKEMNCFEITNPKSENEKLRDLTSGELLKELKARGFVFGNVKFQQDVDMSALQ